MVRLDISILTIDFVFLLFCAGEVLVVSFIVPSLQLVRGISLFHSPPISFMLHGLMLVFLLCTHFEVG